MPVRGVPACLLLILPLIAGCVRSNYNVATNRQEYTLTSTEKEVETGRKLARRVERELTLVADEEVQRRVREIGARIAAASDRRELVYTFGVVEDDAVNAFSLPGGYIYFNRGLVENVATDDELAGVVAHEVAHVAARHAVRRFESGLGLQLATLATIAAGQGQAAQGLSVASQAAQLAYARQDELEADRLAVKYMKAAGYDPKGILDFLTKLRELDQDKTHYLPRGVVRPQYGLTHPFVPERIREVKEALYGVADYIDYLNTPE
jgi:predicted Zn-dependent protease